MTRPKGLIFSEGSTLAAMKVKGSVKPRCFDDGTKWDDGMVGWDLDGLGLGWVLFVGLFCFGGGGVGGWGGGGGGAIFLNRGLGN